MMLDRYITIEHQETGERLVLDKVAISRKRHAMGFLNGLRVEPGFVKHIVFTQAVESFKPNLLNNFFNQLRRRYGRVRYIKTVEVQEKRFIKYGERVLHWHCLVAFDIKIDFGKEDVFALQRFWKYGGLEIIPVRRCSMGYVMKYINKSLDVECEDKIQRISSSRIPAYFRQSFTKFLKALSWFVQAGASLGEMDLSGWDYKGAFVYFGTKLGHWRKCIRELRVKKYLYMNPKSMWKRVNPELDFFY